jgi:hypothetical protein
MIATSKKSAIHEMSIKMIRYFTPDSLLVGESVDVLIVHHMRWKTMIVSEIAGDIMYLTNENGLGKKEAFSRKSGERLRESTSFHITKIMCKTNDEENRCQSIR